jgi:hypothetical protein
LHQGSVINESQAFNWPSIFNFRHNNDGRHGGRDGNGAWNSQKGQNFAEQKRNCTHGNKTAEASVATQVAAPVSVPFLNASAPNTTAANNN